MQLTQEQQQAHDAAIDYLKSIISGSWRQPLVIGGFAGTGKTHLITEISKTIQADFPKDYFVSYSSYTGKASSVLKSRMNGIRKSDYVGTLHSLMYHPKLRYDPELNKMVIYEWEKKEEILYNAIIIDEASMIPYYLWQDLKWYNKPIIAIGDHAQLPPVKDTFNIMENTDLELKNVHRYVANSPLMKLSTFVRANGFIPSISNQDIIKIPWTNSICQKYWNGINFDEDTICLCGFNSTRVSINNSIRKRLSFNTPEPYPGERIICLKNNHDKKIMNGQLATVLWFMPYTPEFYRMTLQLDGFEDPVECLVSNHCFGQESYGFQTINSRKLRKIYQDTEHFSVDYFDFGYAITVHKSQGSEWDKVVLFEQRPKFWDDDFYRRWLYTAVTRAKKKLFIISNYY